MKIEMFIKVDNDGKAYRENGTYSYANTGVLLYEIGSVLPIIKKGVGCIGLGVVLSFEATPNTTTIHFKALSKISDDAKAAYYDLYRLNSDGAGDAEYEDTDQFIPAMAGFKQQSYTKMNKPKSRPSTFDDIFDN